MRDDHSLGAAAIMKITIIITSPSLASEQQVDKEAWNVLPYSVEGEGHRWSWGRAGGCLVRRAR